MKLLVVRDSVQLSTREVIIIISVFSFMWVMGYTTGAQVTRVWEKTAVMYDCIFTPAPEDSNRV